MARRDFATLSPLGAAYAVILVAISPAAYAAQTVATVTTLTVTSGTHSVTNVAAGAVVTLKAKVTAGGTALTSGTVNFCDALAKYCSDIHLLGNAQLNKSGDTQVSFRPGLGEHSYKAVFAGTTSYTSSSSRPSALSVTGRYRTATTLAAAQGTENYTLTVSVAGYAPKTEQSSPAGSVSFLDLSSENALLGAVSLGAGVQGLNWLALSQSATNSYPIAIAVGDFNGDGIPDFVVPDYSYNEGGFGESVQVFIGNGEGTFTPGETLATGDGPYWIAVGDFNGDGIPDLAVVNALSNNVSVFIGNGDGTFTASTQSMTTGNTPEGIATGDFNRDGNLDLAVVNSYSNSVSIFLGNGDGTFTTAAESPATGDTPDCVVVADFNGDGIPDLAISNWGQTSVTILLGKGDGTFTQGSSPPAGDVSQALVAADFNGDGKADLAVVNWQDNNLTILLGKGDGTFTEAHSPKTGFAPFGIASADFNQDGIPDLAVANQGDDTTTILLGKGDGTFTAAAVSPSSGTTPNAVAAVDLNGDGIPDLAITDTNNLSGNQGAVSVLLTENRIATSTANGIGPVGSGTHQVEAIYRGDNNFAPSISAAVGLEAAPQAAKPAFSPEAGTYAVAQTVTIKDATYGATIYYTTDGKTTPTTSSKKYAGPIDVNSSQTLKAIAVASGYANSAVATAAYTILHQSANAPAFLPAPGNYYAPQRVTLADSTPNAIIYYTTDGRTVPTSSSIKYTHPIAVSSSETILAVAVAPGYANSAVVSGAYTITDATSVGDWTWIGGSKTIPAAQGIVGVYGTQGTPASGNFPGPRYGANSWTDSSGNLWLFGGLGFDEYGNNGDLNDLWEFLPSTHEWVWVSGSNSTNQPGVYGTKNTPSPENVPGSRYYAASWTDASGNFWLFGGIALDSVGGFGYVNDLWEFSPSTRMWTWRSGSKTAGQLSVFGKLGEPATGNVPGGRNQANAWTDMSGNLWLFGGFGPDSTGTDGYLNDFWKFTPSTGKWTWMGGSQVAGAYGVYGMKGQAAISNFPGCRNQASSWTDRRGNLWLFGGVGTGSYAGDWGPLNDLWIFNPSTKRWTWMSGSQYGAEAGTYGTLGIPASGNIPGVRQQAFDWTDSEGNLWLFGGQGDDANNAFGLLNDLWKFSPSSDEWAWMGGSKIVGSKNGQRGVYGILDTPAYANVPGGRSAGVSWTDKSGNFWLFGGAGIDSTGKDGDLNDLWVYEPPAGLLPAAPPAFSPTPGTFGVAVSVTLSDSTNGATIYYTTDGETKPTIGSAKYTGSSIKVNHNTTIMAIAAAQGRANSAVAAGTYTFQCVKPAFRPAAGNYTGAQLITITDGTSGARIYYTTNGSKPSTGSTRYTAPFKITKTTTVRAFATMGGYLDSAVAAATFTIR
jgi:N-acetylneuraminic acid mutarotase